MVNSLDDLLCAAGFTSTDIRQVHDGNLVKNIAESVSDRELAVKFAFLVKADADSLKESFLTTTKSPEKDPSVLQSGIIKTGTLEDFANVVLEPNTSVMLQEYLNAGPGSTLNLSNQEIQGWKALRVSRGNERERVEKHLREMLLERYLAYRENGLDGIQPYVRSSGKEYYPGQELRQKTAIAEILHRESPVFHKHLLDYPHARPEGLGESYSWVIYKIDDKPTIALIHRMGLLEGHVYVFSERHFYVSRSHNSLQGIGGAFPVENGTVVTYLQRTSTDQVAGFGGSTKRAIGARMMASKVAENFERSRNLAAEK